MDRLLLVPGNHDVDCAAIKHGARALHKEILDNGSQQTIAEILDEPDDRAVLLRRHSGYLALYNAWFGTAEARLPWWERP